MHSLAKERVEETEALEYVVNEVRRFVRGELLAASFRKKIKAKQEEEDEKLKKELEEQRVKEALKKQLSKKMNTATSINADDGV